MAASRPTLAKSAIASVFLANWWTARGYGSSCRRWSSCGPKGFKDFVVEINGDNMQYASAARRAEIEAFLAKEEELPVARTDRRFQRLVFGGPAPAAHGEGGLVHRPFGLVGDLRVGDLRGVDVQASRHRLERRRPRRADIAREGRPAIRRRRCILARANHSPRLHRGRLVETFGGRHHAAGVGGGHDERIFIRLSASGGCARCLRGAGIVPESMS